MRRLAALALGSVVLLAGSVPALAEDRPAPRAPEPRLEFLYVETTGVTAEEAPAVAKAITAVEGVRSFAWTTEGAEAKIVREAGKAADATLLEKAKAAGAEKAGVVPIASATLTFDKKLHCGGCVAVVTKALQGVKGVKESVVPQDLATVVVIYDTRASKPADFEAALAAAGKPAKAPASKTP